MPWVIKDWATIYESSESRKVKNLEWIRVPIRHDGAGFRFLMQTPEGQNAFACFMLMVQVGGKMPKRGTLATTSGDVTAGILELKTGMPASNFAAAFELLESDEVGWIYWDAPEDPDAPGESARTSGRAGRSPGHAGRLASSGDAGITRQNVRMAPQNVRTNRDIHNPQGSHMKTNDPPERRDDPPERRDDPPEHPDVLARSRATRREERREEEIKSERPSTDKVQELERETRRLQIARSPLTQSENAEAERSSVHDLEPINRTRAGENLAIDASPKNGNFELAQMRHVMQLFASHVTRQTWRLPDMEITRAAMSAAKGRPLSDVALFLRGTAMRKQAAGNLPLSVGSYAFVVRLIDDEFKAIELEKAEAAAS